MQIHQQVMKEHAAMAIWALRRGGRPKAMIAAK
jgi:hypothetical protein